LPQSSPPRRSLPPHDRTLGQPVVRPAGRVRQARHVEVGVGAAARHLAFAGSRPAIPDSRRCRQAFARVSRLASRVSSLASRGRRLAVADSRLSPLLAHVAYLPHLPAVKTARRPAETWHGRPVRPWKSAADLPRPDKPAVPQQTRPRKKFSTKKYL